MSIRMSCEKREQKCAEEETRFQHRNYARTGHYGGGLAVLGVQIG